MPLLAPDAATPEQQPVAVLTEARASALSLHAGAFEVLLMGPRPVGDHELQRAVASSRDLSGALRALSQRYAEAGYPAAKLWYALDGQTLYVVASLGRVQGADLPPPLDRYFRDLPEGVLHEADLEPRRILASIHADRAGLSRQAVFRESGGHQVLTADETDDDAPRRFGLAAELHNRGNRFVGRHFLDVSGRLDFATGDELTATWNHAIAEWNHARSDRYEGGEAGWTRVTPLGLFGLSGNFSSFDFDLATIGGDVPAEGDIRRVELAWLAPLRATRDARLTANAEVSYDDKRTTALDGDAVLQDQEYASLEAGLAWSAGTAPDAPWGYALRCQLRQGLGRDRTDRPTVGADLGYFLARPSIELTFSPESDWVFAGEATAQWTRDPLPEQSQWVLGGVDAITAYLPGVAIGDTGGLVRVEARREGEPDAPFRVEPRLFVEHGWTHAEDPDVGGLPAGRQRLTDVGLGITLRHRAFSASLVSAIDVDHRGVDSGRRDDSRAHVVFSVAAKL